MRRKTLVQIGAWIVTALLMGGAAIGLTWGPPAMWAYFGTLAGLVIILGGDWK